MNRWWLIIVLALAPMGWGKNVDLSTVPKRDSVQLTIYNSEDITLVRERRTVTFRQGMNPLQFSWANTLIDASSVQLRFIEHKDDLEVEDTTFPHDKPQMLYWNVASRFAGPAEIEITYFTSGITWKADYLGIANADETQLSLDGFVRVYNNSGEKYEDAEIRLVVGTINLVEKIAALAHLPMDQVKQSMDQPQMKAMRDMAFEDADGILPATRPAEMDEKKIIKQGLSEYFIYTIEGTETIDTGWSKRMRSIEAKAVAMKIQYRYRPVEYGDQLVRMYLLTNDKDSKLGTTPLPDGVVRVFRDNGRDGLSYLTSQAIKYIPIGDKIELNLGVDPKVVFELIKQKSFRDNIWMKVQGANVYQSVADGAAKINLRSEVAGWDDHEMFAQRIRNYTGKSIEVQIRRSFSGDVIFRSALKPVLFDYVTPEFGGSVDAGKKLDLGYEIVTHEGYNQKQSHVTLETAKPLD